MAETKPNMLSKLWNDKVKPHRAKVIALLVGFVSLAISCYLIFKSYMGELRTFSMPMWALFLVLIVPLVVGLGVIRMSHQSKGDTESECTKQVSKVYIVGILVLLLLVAVHLILAQYRHLTVDIPYEFLTIIPAIGGFALAFPERFLSKLLQRDKSK
jgi:fumarate reductase subunit D